MPTVHIVYDPACTPETLAVLKQAVQRAVVAALSNGEWGTEEVYTHFSTSPHNYIGGHDALVLVEPNWTIGRFLRSRKIVATLKAELAAYTGRWRRLDVALDLRRRRWFQLAAR